YGGDVLAGSPAADLVAKDAADHGADHCTWNVGAALRLPGFHPAALLGGPDHRPHRRDVRLEQALLTAAAIIPAVMDHDRCRRIAAVVDARTGAHFPHR